ncbi:phage Gp37/Gp68 family protein [Sphingomonas bacterium]|uniref:phage Gp37/Gp68 family protein n=1 Tax=Sphingomonas bacterium TaxID=1895847 RepID=UPI00157619A3|nr:phage Gp37/Gp68 family protein [Sphingomonas bacterium]
MAERSAIEWTDHTFNGWIGCTKIGPGCDHCYAEVLATTRLGVPWGPGAQRRRTAASTWNQPRRWNRRAAAAGVRERVFCSSLADVFDNEVSAEWRADLFRLIRETPNLDWLLVTKRIGNAARMAEVAGGWPANVWLGATIVSQAEADRDAPKLLSTDGPRIRFLSMEPLLGPVDLTMLHYAGLTNINALTGAHGLAMPMQGAGPRLDWIIVGGESGPGARPMHPGWVRSLRDQCASVGVPLFFKQWGEFIAHPAPNAVWKNGEAVPAELEPVTFERIGKKAAGRLLDSVTHDGRPA